MLLLLTYSMVPHISLGPIHQSLDWRVGAADRRVQQDRAGKLITACEKLVKHMMAVLFQSSNLNFSAL